MDGIEELMDKIDELIEEVDKDLIEQIGIDNDLRDIRSILENMKKREETITPQAVKNIEKALYDFRDFRKEARERLQIILSSRSLKK